MIDARHCSCGARLRREKTDGELCDPCDARIRRDADLAQPDDRTCKECEQRPPIVRSGMYAWLCGPCRDVARDRRAAA